MLSVDVGILISEDIGATNANKQGLVTTEIIIGGVQLGRYFWDEIKLYTDSDGTIVSAVLPHGFVVAPGQTYTLSVITTDFAKTEIDSWVEREW